MGSAQRQVPWRLATTGTADDDVVRRTLLTLFAAALPLAIAVQQTALALLLAYLAVVLWRRRRLPRSPVLRKVAWRLPEAVQPKLW